MSNYTLLLIDYEPRSIERMRRPLEQAGIRVEVATDGAAGLAAFERLQPDAVIVEAMLPKRHGFEVCQEIKKTSNGKRTPVIVTTGVYKGRRYRTQAMHIHGADEYLEKPLTDEQIVDTIRKFLADRPPRAAEPSPAAVVAPPSASTPPKVPPAPGLELDADAADIFEIIDESLSLPNAAAPTPPKPAPSTTARSTAPIGDLSDDEIAARLDALLPSDPSMQTQVSWEAGHAVGHLEPSMEVRAPEVTAAVAEVELPTEFAPMPEVGALPEDIAVDPRHVDLEPPRPPAQVVPFDASRPSRKKETPATPIPQRAVGTAAVAPVVEIAPAPRVAPAPAVEVPLTESYETPKRGLPWWIWVVAAAGLATGIYFAFFRSEPAPANAIAVPAPASAPALPQTSTPEPQLTPSESSSALPVEPASATPPPIPFPVPESPKPAPVAVKVAAPVPAPPSKPAPTVPSAPTTLSATTQPPAQDPAPLENLEDPSLAVTPVTPVVAAPVASKPSTRPGDLVSLNDVDTPPMGLQKPAPQYTSLARTRRQEGTVVMELLVDETGRVADVRLVRGIPGSDLNDAAMEAARSWVYKPAEKDGVPVRVWRPEQVRFKL